MKCSKCGRTVNNSAVRIGKITECPRCGDPLGQPPERMSQAGLGLSEAQLKTLHYLLFVAGVICLVVYIGGFILSARGQFPESSPVITLAFGGLIVFAIVDAIVYIRYKKAAKEKGHEGHAFCPHCGQAVLPKAVVCKKCKQPIKSEGSQDE